MVFRGLSLSDALKKNTVIAGPNRLLDGPILTTLVALSLPNVAALSVLSVAAIAETTYIGWIGREALAAMALVFPTIMLTQMMSSGAMGGGVSSAISRALGSGNDVRAENLAMHALMIGLSVGGTLSLAMYLAGPWLYAILGGNGAVLTEAVAYARTFFSGAVAIWLFNSLLSIVRGTGNMRLSSMSMVGVGFLQIVLGGVLSQGLGPIPACGIEGIAAAQILAYACGCGYLLWVLTRPETRLRLRSDRVGIQADMFLDILKVGAIACLSPIQSILVVLLLSRMASGFGVDALAGFGIGIRLELLLVPIAFAIGVACVPMVGMAIGADRIERARRVAWSGALLAAGLIGAIGIGIAIEPKLWGRLFTTNPAVLDAAGDYLEIAGFGFPAYGLGLCLYFASQGSGRILGPVLAGTARLAVVIAGGYLFMGSGSTFLDLARLVLVAMLVYGGATAISVYMTRWSKN